LGVRDVYRRFFEESPKDAQAAEDVKAWADGTLALWEQKAFRDLVEALEALAAEEIRSGPDATSMAAAIGESNGVKKVVKLIKSDLLRARRIYDATGAKGE